MSEEFDIEDLLKKHLLDEREAPPIGLFEKIDAQVMGQKKRKKRFFFLLWFGLGALTVVALTVINITNNAEPEQGVSAAVTAYNGKAEQESRKSLEHNDLFVQNESNLTDAGLDSLSFTKSNLQNNASQTEQGGLEFNTQHSNKSTQSKNISKTVSKLDKETKNELIDPSSLTEVKKDTSTKNKELTNTSSDLISAQNDVAILSEIEKDSTLDKGRKSDNSNPIEKDSTLAEVFVDSSALEIEIDTNFITENESTLSDSIPDTASNIPPPETVKKSKYGAIVYGGPALFDIAVFKPYFESGALSSVAFPSSGYEIGFGIYRRIKDRFTIQALMSYNALKTEFDYDLMISETDYFDLYETGDLIPIENLDNPESCNCYLAEDATLNYKMSSFAFSLSTSFDLISRPKFTVGPQFTFSGMLNTKFTNNSSSVIQFSTAQKEQFKGSRLEAGLSFYYQITDRFQIGFTPSYGMQFTKKSAIYAKNMQRILIPLSLKIGF